MADAKAQPWKMAPGMIRLWIFVWAFVVIVLWGVATYALFVNDRALGLWLMSWGFLAFVVPGWAFRWLQKRGHLAAPSAV